VRSSTRHVVFQVPPSLSFQLYTQWFAIFRPMLRVKAMEVTSLPTAVPIHRNSAMVSAPNQLTMVPVKTICKESFTIHSLAATSPTSSRAATCQQRYLNDATRHSAPLILQQTLKMSWSLSQTLPATLVMSYVNRVDKYSMSISR
jgi:hypothetical protein